MLVSNVDWGHLFSPDIPLLESFIRGTIVYFLVFVLIRGTLRRTAGQLMMLDFIFVFLVANAAQNPMTGGSNAISNGVVLIVTVIGWNYLFNTLSWYVPVFDHLMTPRPLLVVRYGDFIMRNMRREFLTVEELSGKLREAGVEDVSQVNAAYIEGDGIISVIRYDASPVERTASLPRPSGGGDTSGRHGHTRNGDRGNDRHE